MAPVLERNPLEAALNTHSNPDHCFGNELLPSATEIYASARWVPPRWVRSSPAMLHGLKSAPGMPPGGLPSSCTTRSGRSTSRGITVRLPSRTFEGRLDIEIAGRGVSFIELGPAHTGGDTIVHVPDASAVFTGDLLFIEGTPGLAGSLSNWIAACERILALDARVLVPGHGPVTDASGVRDVRRYLSVRPGRGAQACCLAGLEPKRRGRRHRQLRVRGLGRSPERLAANVVAAYRGVRSALPAATPVELFIRDGALARGPLGRLSASAMADRRALNGAQALIRTLGRLQASTTCFSNPGTSEMHFKVAALDSRAARCVPC